MSTASVYCGMLPVRNSPVPGPDHRIKHRVHKSSSRLDKMQELSLRQPGCTQPRNQLRSQFRLEGAPFAVGRQAKPGIDLKEGLGEVPRLLDLASRHQARDKPSQVGA